MCDLNPEFLPYITKNEMVVYRFIIFEIRLLGFNQKN